MAIKNNRTGEVSYIGQVLHVRGTFRMDTSMDEVLLWHPETKTTTTIYIMGDSWATVDASDETKAAYRQSIIDLQSQFDAENIENKAKSIQVESTIKVIKGRNVPKGTIAKVLRIIEHPAYKMLILDNGMKTYAQNVLIQYKGEFITPEYYREKKFFFQAI